MRVAALLLVITACSARRLVEVEPDLVMRVQALAVPSEGTDRSSLHLPGVRVDARLGEWRADDGVSPELVEWLDQGLFESCPSLNSKLAFLDCSEMPCLGYLWGSFSEASWPEMSCQTADGSFPVTYLNHLSQGGEEMLSLVAIALGETSDDAGQLQTWRGRVSREVDELELFDRLIEAAARQYGLL